MVQNENVVPEDDRVLHLLVYGKFLRALDDKTATRRAAEATTG